MRLSLALFVAFFVAIPGSLAAPSPTYETSIPQALREWVPWVRAGISNIDCPTDGKERQCIWPGTISFDLKDNGAVFVSSVVMFSEGELALPSSQDLPVHSLSVASEDGTPVEAPAIHSADGLRIRLPKGRFKVSGAFTWTTPPGPIPVPGEYGILTARPERQSPDAQIARDDRSFRIVSAANDRDADALTLTVFRKIVDGTPVKFDTRINLRVSGGSRSVQLGKVLPDGAVPVSIDTSLPHQLKSDGTLAVQLVPGEYSIDITAIIQQPVTSVTLPKPDSVFWPQEETVIFEPNTTLRSVEVKGLSPLSAELAQLPEGWSDDSDATYVAQAGGTFSLEELSRGEQARAPSSVTLERSLWIDLDGNGFTARDRFSGVLSNSDRLNALEETQIGRALVDNAPVLVASDPNSKAAGIEIRNSNLSIEAVSKIDKDRTVSAVGWDQIVDTLNLSLSLPPSWQLIKVGGASYASGSWFDSWTLLDVFLSMLVAVAAYHLFGRFAAIFVALSLVLNHDEFLAPRLLIVHLMLLVVWRSVIQRKESIWFRLNSLMLLATFSAVVLQSLAFVKLQVTQLLYPQLQAGTRYRTILQELLNVFESSFLTWPYLLFILGFGVLALQSILRGKNWIRRAGRLAGWSTAFIFVVIASGIITAGGAFIIGGAQRPYYENTKVTGSPSYESQRPRSEAVTSEYESGSDENSGGSSNQMATKNRAFSFENKVFLAGPAIPSWQWRTHSIVVDGPVGPNLNVRFFLLPPFATRTISLLRVIALLALLTILFKRLGYALPSRRISTSTAASLLATLLCFSQTAKAEMPSDELLNELKERLLKQECQRELCTTLLDLDLSIDDGSYAMSLLASSDGASSVTIPGALSVFVPESVTVNGKETIALRRSKQNYLQVQVNHGTSKIEIRGSLLERAAFSMQFPQRPQHMAVSTKSWFVEGLSGNGSPAETVRFTNRTANSTQQDNLKFKEAEKLPTWTVASRQVFIGDQIAVATSLTRLGDLTRPFAVEVPLLPGENVTTPGFRSNGKTIFATFQADESTLNFASTIPYTTSLSLEAVSHRLFTEDWSLTCAPIVNCMSSGLRPSTTITDGMKLLEWMPFVGEKVSVTIVPLKGITGDVMTIDSVTHALNWGANILDASISSNVRTTQQHSLAVSLPDGASLKSVIVDQQPGNSVLNSNTVSLLLNPGEHNVQVSYTLTALPSFRDEVPLIKFNVPVNNVTIQVSPADSRWLIWTGGVTWGPAVVFWSKLFFVLVICLVIAWLGLVPLGMVGASLLAVGLTTLPVIYLVVPLGWLVTLKLLPQFQPSLKYVPNWIQITAFAVLTLIALASFYRIVQIGLVLSPPMLIAGNQSTAASLRWFVDHADNALPQPWILSLSIEWWRVFALAWSTWLVIAIIRWIKQSVVTVKQLL